MRKIALFTIASLSLTVLACKKDYTCSCQGNYSGADTTWTANDTTFVLEKMREDDAIAKCNESDKSTTFLTETYTLECELD